LRRAPLLGASYGEAPANVRSAYLAPLLSGSP